MARRCSKSKGAGDRPVTEDELLALMKELELTPFDELTDAQKRAWRDAFTQWLALQRNDQ